MLEQTPKSLLIGTGMTLLGGAMWGMNSTVAKLLMRDYQLDPVWLSCVRALFASLIFLVGSAITTPGNSLERSKTSNRIRNIWPPR